MLEEVILVLLNKKPVHRYSSAAALKQTLSTLYRAPNPLGLPSWFAPPVGAETYRRPRKSCLCVDLPFQSPQLFDPFFIPIVQTTSLKFFVFFFSLDAVKHSCHIR